MLHDRASISNLLLSLTRRPRSVVHNITLRETKIVRISIHGLGIQPPRLPKTKPCTFAIMSREIGYADRPETDGLRPAIENRDLAYTFVCAIPVR